MSKFSIFDKNKGFTHENVQKLAFLDILAIFGHFLDPLKWPLLACRGVKIAFGGPKKGQNRQIRPFGPPKCPFWHPRGVPNGHFGPLGPPPRPPRTPQKCHFAANRHPPPGTPPRPPPPPRPDPPPIFYVSSIVLNAG